MWKLSLEFPFVRIFLDLTKGDGLAAVGHGDLDMRIIGIRNFWRYVVAYDLR